MRYTIPAKRDRARVSHSMAAAVAMQEHAREGRSIHGRPDATWPARPAGDAVGLADAGLLLFAELSPRESRMKGYVPYGTGSSETTGNDGGRDLSAAELSRRERIQDARFSTRRKLRWTRREAGLIHS